ncbi:MAG: hypothetical protein P8J33_08190, partial [Pirellulaceae bacterium]|nr:hypothetical protein [Pirellulaceae bacterium]
YDSGDRYNKFFAQTALVKRSQTTHGKTSFQEGLKICDQGLYRLKLDSLIAPTIIRHQFSATVPPSKFIRRQDR